MDGDVIMKDFSIRIEGIHEDLDQVVGAVKVFLEEFGKLGTSFSHASVSSGHFLGGSQDLTAIHVEEAPKEPEALSAND